MLRLLPRALGEIAGEQPEPCGTIQLSKTFYRPQMTGDGKNNSATWKQGRHDVAAHLQGRALPLPVAGAERCREARRAESGGLRLTTRVFLPLPSACFARCVP